MFENKKKNLTESFWATPLSEEEQNKKYLLKENPVLPIPG